MLFAAMTGCSKKAEDAAPATDAEAPAQTSQDSTETAEGEPKKYNVTLHVVGVDNVVSTTFMQYADELEELYGITIDFQQFSNEQSSNKIAVSMAAGGSDIDVMMIRPLDGTLLYSQNGWLENLQPYIDADPSVEYDDFMTACADVCTNADGDTVCLPVMTESGVIFYNKTLFEKAGITKTPETWEELYETAVKLNDPANDICGFACRGSGNPAVTQFSAVIRSFGGDFFDENKNATINTPEAIEAFQFYGKLLRDAGPAGVLNMGWIETWNLFTQGKCAMRLDANTNLGSWSDDDSVISRMRLASLTCRPARTATTATITSLPGLWLSVPALRTRRLHGSLSSGLPARKCRSVHSRTATPAPSVLLGRGLPALAAGGSGDRSNRRQQELRHRPSVLHQRFRGARSDRRSHRGCN